MKYLLEYRTFTTAEEDKINDILDRGLDNASERDIEILKNQGRVKKKTYFVAISDKLSFTLSNTEDYGNKLKVSGILHYKGEDYLGWFLLPKTEENRGKNTWGFFKDNREFDPEPDDLYELDDMIQEIEFEYLDD